MYVLLLFSFLISLTVSFSQTVPSNIDGKHAKRVDDIITALKLKDTENSLNVRAILVQHLENIHKVFSRRKASMDSLVIQDTDQLSKAKAQIWDNENGNLNKLQATFLGKLSATSLLFEEIEQIKDLMTEGGRMREFDNYIALLPAMNNKQKNQVMSYLTEARENAMSAETAKERVQWFIKYRGRANNFLAAAGYNLREATERLDKLRLKKEGIQSNNNS